MCSGSQFVHGRKCNAKNKQNYDLFILLNAMSSQEKVVSMQTIFQLDGEFYIDLSPNGHNSYCGSSRSFLIFLLPFKRLPDATIGIDYNV